MASTLKVNTIAHSGGTNALTVDSSGRVGRPKVPSWLFNTGDAHGAMSGGTAYNPLQWNQRQVDTDGAGGTMIKGGTNHTIVIPVTGIYWVAYGGIKGSSSSAVGRMNMNRTSGSGMNVFPACRGEENSPYAEMYVAYVFSAVAGDEYQIQTLTDGMWMGGAASQSNGYNDPFWTGYLIG